MGKDFNWAFDSHLASRRRLILVRGTIRRCSKCFDSAVIYITGTNITTALLKTNVLKIYSSLLAWSSVYIQLKLNLKTRTTSCYTDTKK